MVYRGGTEYHGEKMDQDSRDERMNRITGQDPQFCG
jgi:hypothetical protein